MKWKFGVPESPMPVYYLAKLLGLAPFVIKNNRFHPPTLLGKVYPVFLAASYSVFSPITASFILDNFKTLKYTSFFETWTIILHFASLPSILFTLVIFLVMHKKIVYLMNKLCNVSNDLHILGIAEDHGKILRNLFVTTLSASAVLTATCVMLILMEAGWAIAHSIRFCIDNCFGFCIIFIFVQILMLINQRFILMNEKLHNLLIPAARPTSPHHGRFFIEIRHAREDNQPGSEGLTDCERIRMIRSLHLELCDLVNRTTHLFATPILLNSLQFAATFVLSFYWIYSVFYHSAQATIAQFLCTALRMTMLTVELFIVAHASATIRQQGNATKIVLFKVWNDRLPPAVTTEFLKFSNQLLHVPVIVSAFGFIDLGYPFLLEIIYVLATYLIVIIQLEPKEP